MGKKEQQKQLLQSLPVQPHFCCQIDLTHCVLPDPDLAHSPPWEEAEPAGPKVFLALWWDGAAKELVRAASLES